MNALRARGGAGATQWVGLFVASFCITLVIRGHSVPPGVSQSLLLMPEAPRPPAATMTVGVEPAPQAPGIAAPADPGQSAPTSPTGQDGYDGLLETALTDEDDQARAVAIRELGRVPPEQAVSALEQVLRSDSDPDNRALAMQMLQQMPSTNEVRPLRLRLMQEFSEDGDARVAALARDGQQRADLR